MLLQAVDRRLFASSNEGAAVITAGNSSILACTQPSSTGSYTAVSDSLAFVPAGGLIACAGSPLRARSHAVTGFGPVTSAPAWRSGRPSTT